jgi:hypothetical protein
MFVFYKNLELKFYLGDLNFRYRRVATTDDAAPITIPAPNCIVKIHKKLWWK